MRSSSRVPAQVRLPLAQKGPCGGPLMPCRQGASAQGSSQLGLLQEARLQERVLPAPPPRLPC